MAFIDGGNLSRICNDRARGEKLGPDAFDTPRLSFCDSLKSGARRFDDNCAFVCLPVQRWIKYGGERPGHGFAVHGLTAVDGPTLSALMETGQITQQDIFTHQESAREEADKRNLGSWLSYSRSMGRGEIESGGTWEKHPVDLLREQSAISRPNLQPARPAASQPA